MGQRPYGSKEESTGAEGAVTQDLTRSTIFAARDAEHFRAQAQGEGEFYPRYGHPNARTFEARMAALEGADGAVCFASGMATLHGVFCGLLQAGDTIACSRDVYGGTGDLLKHDLGRFGIEVRRFDPFSEEETVAAVQPPVKLVHVESPTNPLVRVVDLERVAGAAHAAGALLSVDATFVPPPLQRPLERGADLVVHSATKFLGGHHDVLGGVVSGRHEQLEMLEAFRRRTGAILGPDRAWLLTRSLDTLEVRVRHMCMTAARLASFLDGLRSEGGDIAAVHYPGLSRHPDFEIATRQMLMPGSMLAFEVKHGLEGATAVYDRLQRITRAPSLGGTESVALLPLYSSHAGLTPEERAEAGIADGLIRISVGLEPADELEADLAQALQV